jgi:hypothetical protein
MIRNLLKEGIISQYSFGIGTGTRRMVLTRAEELATIRGDWLHKVSASGFEARLRTSKAAAKEI